MRLEHIFESVKENVCYKYITDTKTVVCLLLDTEKSFATKLRSQIGAGRVNKTILHRFVSDKPVIWPVG